MTSPVTTVRTFYDAIARGDVPAVLSILDPNVEWTEAERFPYYSGTWHGPQAIVDNLLVPLDRDWASFSITPRDFVAESDRVVTFGTYAGTYRRTGRSMTAAFAHLWTIRDEKIVGFAMHTDTAKVLEATQDVRL